MITLEEKLERFMSLVLDAVARNVDEAARAQAAQESSLRAARQQAAEQQAAQYCQQHDDQVQDEIRQLKARARQRLLQRALQQQGGMLEDLTQELTTRARRFVSTPEYRNYLSQLLAASQDQWLSQPQLSLACLESDRESIASLLKGWGYAGELHWISLPPGAIGGLILELTDDHLRFDMTLQSAIHSSRDRMAAKLYHLLEEREDRHHEPSS